MCIAYKVLPCSFKMAAGHCRHSVTCSQTSDAKDFMVNPFGKIYTQYFVMSGPFNVFMCSQTQLTATLVWGQWFLNLLTNHALADRRFKNHLFHTRIVKQSRKLMFIMMVECIGVHGHLTILNIAYYHRCGLVWYAVLLEQKWDYLLFSIDSGLEFFCLNCQNLFFYLLRSHI